MRVQNGDYGLAAAPKVFCNMLHAPASHIIRLNGNSNGLCHQSPEGAIMKSGKRYILGLSLIVMMTAAAPLVSAQAAHLSWDIISVDFGTNPPSLNPGGTASATASDTSCITIAGSGTFLAPASGKSSSDVTGGGT